MKPLPLPSRQARIHRGRHHSWDRSRCRQNRDWGERPQRVEWTLLNGNQLMVVLTRFVLEQQTSMDNSFIASTVVSTAT